MTLESIRPARARRMRALVLAGALLAGCSGGERRPSIVLVLVDQLRKDAAERWMPEVDALAARGVIFDNMRSAAPWTYPSVISLFSGLYPQQHGADADPLLGGKRLKTFDAALPLLPRVLGDDYYTAAFVTSPFLQTWNPFHAAFDDYTVDEFIGSEGNLRGFPKAVWKSTMFADTVNRVLREHLDARPCTGPEFVYVHYIDVHGPWDGAPFEAGPPTPPEALNERAYEAGARFVDHKIRELYDYFRARYGDDLLFLVTADHGQELGDDRTIGEGPQVRERKNTVHDFNTRIPLFLLPGARVPSGVRVEIPCSNVDLFPTLLEWAGLEPPAGLPGKSLVSAVRGQVSSADFERPIYSKMSAFGRANDCVVVGSRKLMRYFDPQSGAETRRVVFDLAADPRETRTLAPADGPSPDVLEREASTHGHAYEARIEEPDAETLEKLHDLGYF